MIFNAKKELHKKDIYEQTETESGYIIYAHKIILRATLTQESFR